MTTDDHNPDLGDIESLVRRQFGSLSWSRGESASWSAFVNDFLPDAALYPAARPAQPQTSAAFVERLDTLAKTTLHSFHERMLGTRIHVFGNVAVAVAGCEMTENDRDVRRGVEMLLLVKTDGKWKIAAQAWDQ